MLELLQIYIGCNRFKSKLLCSCLILSKWNIYLCLYNVEKLVHGSPTSNLLQIFELKTMSTALERAFLFLSSSQYHLQNQNIKEIETKVFKVFTVCTPGENRHSATTEIASQRVLLGLCYPHSTDENIVCFFFFSPGLASVAHLMLLDPAMFSGRDKERWLNILLEKKNLLLSSVSVLHASLKWPLIEIMWRKIKPQPFCSKKGRIFRVNHFPSKS